MALERHQNFGSAQYLENKWIEFHQILLMHLYLYKIKGRITTFHISLTCSRVKALECCQKFVSAQYF